MSPRTVKLSDAIGLVMTDREGDDELELEFAIFYKLTKLGKLFRNWSRDGNSLKTLFCSLGYFSKWGRSYANSYARR